MSIYYSPDKMFAKIQYGRQFWNGSYAYPEGQISSCLWISNLDVSCYSHISIFEEAHSFTLKKAKYLIFSP